MSRNRDDSLFVGACLSWSALAAVLWVPFSLFFANSWQRVLHTTSEDVVVGVLVYAAINAGLQRLMRGRWHGGCTLGSIAGGVLLFHWVEKLLVCGGDAERPQDVSIVIFLSCITFLGFVFHYLELKKPDEVE